MSLLGIDMQCDDCFDWVKTPATKISVARRWLRVRGWGTRNEGDGLKDYCPNCRGNHLPKKRE